MDTALISRSKDHEDRIYTAGEHVSVLLPLPLNRAFTYEVPRDLTVCEGDFVKVGFGQRQVVGVIWGSSLEIIPANKVRCIAELKKFPRLPAESRRFIDWVSSYTMQLKGLVLKMSMSVRNVFDPKTSKKLITISPRLPEFKRTKARERVLKVLSGGERKHANELIQTALVSRQTIKKMLTDGVLIEVSVTEEGSESYAVSNFNSVEFSCEQQIVADRLVNNVKLRRFGVSLLDGVPGSGKTEVYFEAIMEALRQNRQILVLLPEISLSTQWLSRFSERFGMAPEVWHSDLSAINRRKTWLKVIRGSTQVLVGTRSALFLPYLNLGLIVVDEEHDNGFKQEEGVIYSARDMAIVRAQIAGSYAILASATPSLETMVNANSGRYELLRLPSRHAGAVLPKIEAIDMLKFPPKHGEWLSSGLVGKIKMTVERGEQVLLFLNRRGYAPLTLCRACGYRFRCSECTSWLVEHRGHSQLQCHQCGFKINTPTKCPECGEENSLTACGPGVERVAEEVKKLFPNNRTIIASSDNIDSPKASKNLISQIESRKVDIIIGTQLVAKGYHFPFLTLVGVIDADLSLQGGDLRAAEKTFQILYQVAGRAGRENRPGTVIIQTYMKAHPVISNIISGNRAAFFESELKARKSADLPPFGRLVALIVSGKIEYDVDKAAHTVGRAAPNYADMEVFGPAPAILSLLRGKHRRRFLIKVKKNKNIQQIIYKWLAALKLPSGIKVTIDIDPLSFM